MKELDFIYRRHSVRRFLDQPVPDGQIVEIINAAAHAPSGKNAQNWHFVVVKNKEKIAGMAGVVEAKYASLSNYLGSPEKVRAFTGMLPYATVFRNAPVVILIYACAYHSVADDLLEAGIMPREEITPYFHTNPGIQNVAAAMENLQLAAAALGYGACWMTGPTTVAAPEISAYLGFNKEGYRLVALTPLGVPRETKHTAPPRKLIAEVMTIID